MSFGVSGVKERGQVLDLAAAALDLALAAAVDRDPVRARSTRRSSSSSSSEPNRDGFELIALRAISLTSASECSGASQVTRSACGSSTVARLVVEVGVLEVGVGERLGDRAVELGVGVDVDRRAHVHALQVEHPHRREPGDLVDQLGVPVVLGVELELELRVACRAACGSPRSTTCARRRRSRRAGSSRRSEAAGGRARPPPRGRARSGAGRGRAPPTRRPSGGSGARPRTRARAAGEQVELADQLAGLAERGRRR